MVAGLVFLVYTTLLDILMESSFLLMALFFENHVDLDLGKLTDHIIDVNVWTGPQHKANPANSLIGFRRHQSESVSLKSIQRVDN